MEDSTKKEHKDILIALGDTIKAIGDNKVGGMIVNFTSAEDPDLVGDYFDADTDLGIHMELPVYYDHGMNPAFGKKSIGRSTIKKVDAGIWFEAELDKANEFEDYILDLARKGKLRSSSGAVGHLVDRIKDGDSYKITSWPLAELSLTTQPAGGMATTVMPLKTFYKAFEDAPEVEATEADTAISALPTESESNAPIEATVAEVEITKTHEGKQVENEQAPQEQPSDQARIDQLEAAISGLTDSIKNMNTETTKEVKSVVEVVSAPTIIKNVGDNLGNGFKHWLKTGDRGGIAHLLTENSLGQEVVEIKASNATDMNTTTAADGGNTVTDDMHNQIIRRADEKSLAAAAGVRRFRSSANVMDIPLDAEADSEFVATTEANAFDSDAPAIGQKVITKSAYTKYVDVSYQLLEASSADVMNFITDRVAIGKAKTDNDLFITEVMTNGTEFKEFAAAGAIAVDELEEVAINNTNAWYVENPDDARFIMAPATHRSIITLDDANIRRYSENALGSMTSRSLLGHKVLWSNKCDALGASNKPVLFGNFSQVAQLEDPGLQFLRDPYTVAINGQVRLLWYYRTAFGVLQAGAVGYGANAAS